MTAKGPYLVGYEEARRAMGEFLGEFYASLEDELWQDEKRMVKTETVDEILRVRAHRIACEGGICYLKDAAAQLQITL